MRSSLITSLKDQSEEDSFDLLICRRTVRGNRQRLRFGNQRIGLARVAGRLESYVNHLVHRDGALLTKAPFMVDRKPTEDRLYVFFARVIEVCVGKVCSQIKQVYGSFFVHINLNKIRRGVT